MAIQFALGWFLWAFVRGTNRRHIFGIFWGLFLQSYLYGTEVIHVFAISAISYIAMWILPRQKCTWFVIPFLMSGVLYNHIDTMMSYEGKYPIDVSTFTML